MDNELVERTHRSSYNTSEAGWRQVSWAFSMSSNAAALLQHVQFADEACFTGA